MKIEDLKYCFVDQDHNEAYLWWTKNGSLLTTVAVDIDFHTIDECLQVAALFRASHLMLEALETAVEAHEKAMELTLSQLTDAGNMVEHIGFPEWYEKAKAAIEAAKNTNETL